MKKLLSIILALTMTIASAATVFGMEMTFKDVKESDWFYNDVKIAFESGIINGKSADSYAPSDNMTYGEAIKLAACMNMLAVNGEVTPLSAKDGEKWYTPYVSYCKEKKITSKEYNYDSNATRAGYMTIFAHCLPEEMLAEINFIEDGSIPDVKMSADYAEAVYRLYRAGILTGVDDAHNCNPNANIQRSEVAAILTRMNDKSTRKEFTLGEKKDEDKEEENKENDKKEDESEKESKTDSLKVQFDNSDSIVKEYDILNTSVKVTGGTAPYTYDWQLYDLSADGENVNMGAKTVYRNGSFVSADSFEEYGDFYFETGKPDFEIEMTRDFSKRFTKLRCIVTDAKGETVKTEAKSILYGGGDSYTNDLATTDFVMYVNEVVAINNGSTDRLVVEGKIENGSVKLGDALRLANYVDGTITTVTVSGIIMFKKSIDSATKGDTCGLVIEGLGSNIDEAKTKVQRGDCLLGYNNQSYSLDVLSMIGRTFVDDGKEIPYDENIILYVNIGGVDYKVSFEAYEDTSEDGSEGCYTRINLLIKSKPFLYLGQSLDVKIDGKKVGTFIIYCT